MCGQFLGAEDPDWEKEQHRKAHMRLCATSNKTAFMQVAPLPRVKKPPKFGKSLGDFRVKIRNSKGAQSGPSGFPILLWGLFKGSYPFVKAF